MTHQPNPKHRSASQYSRLFGLLLLLALAALSAAAAAEPATGTLTGNVTNAATGEVIANAVVTVENSAVVAQTDLDGSFTVQLPAGLHQLVISYTDMDDLRQAVSVPAGDSVTRAFALSSSVQRLEKMVVSAQRAGQAAAIHEERYSPNVRTVAEIDSYGNPGAQMGEFVQRLAGIAVDGSGGNVGAVYVRGMSQDFSSLLIDGNQIATSGGTSLTNGNVYFGQVSTGNIASLELIKAPTPDMDGNAIGGYINVRTRRNFERGPGRTIVLTAGTSWGDTFQDRSVPMKDTPQLDLINLAYSEVFSVFGGTHNLGVNASLMRNAGNTMIVEAGPRQASAAQTGFFVANPQPGADPEPLQRAFGAGQWGTVGHASPDLNLGLSADYKLNQNTVLYVKSTYSRVKRASGSWPSYFRWKLTAPAAAASFLPGSTYDTLEARNGTLDLESVLYVRESEGTAVSGGLERKFPTRAARLNVDFSFSKNRTGYPMLNQVTARMTGVGWWLDRRDRDPWTPFVRQTAGADWSDPANYTVRNDTTLISYAAPSERWGGRADFQKDFFGRWPFTLKLGVKQANFHQTANRDLNYYTYAGPATTRATGGIAPFVGYNIKMTYGRYGPFPFLQLPTTGMAGDIWADRSNWRQTSSDLWNTVYQSTLNDVEFSDTINATYVQGNVKIGRVRFLSGLRIEETRTEGSSFTRVSNATNNNLATATPEQAVARARDNFREWVTAGTKYSTSLPSAHLTYTISANWQARASYNASITRPSPASLLPNIVPNEDAHTLSAGNPNLRPYTADNFDVSIARYFSNVGQLSIGGFYKRIQNYFRSFRDTVPEGPNNGFAGEYAGWTITQNRNIGRARIRGIEFQYQQRYPFLPGVLRGLGSHFNFTYLDTYGDYGAVATSKQLPNLTPRSWNAGVSWAGRGLSLRLMANYRSSFYRSVASGNFGSGPGVMPGTGSYVVYQHERLLLDFKLQYSLTRATTLLFDVYNLTRDYGANDFVHLFGREIPSYASGQGTSFRLGLRTTF